MGNLTQRLIRELHQEELTLSKGDLRIISELFEKAWYGRCDSAFQEVEVEDISVEEAGMLRAALLDALHRESRPDSRRALLLTAASIDERSIREDLIREPHLALEIHREATANLWGALLALDDIKEDVFEKDSRSISYVQDNIDCAARYLKKQGIPVPL